MWFYFLSFHIFDVLNQIILFNEKTNSNFQLNLIEDERKKQSFFATLGLLVTLLIGISLKYLKILNYVLRVLMKKQYVYMCIYLKPEQAPNNNEENQQQNY